MRKEYQRPQRDLPLEGLVVLENSKSVAAAYAGKLLSNLGAEVIILEPNGGSSLRNMPPLLPDGESSLFAYLSAGKKSAHCDLSDPDSRHQFDDYLSRADIFIDDTDLLDRSKHKIGYDDLKVKKPDLVYVSVLPFGAKGEKANWHGEEINLIHSGGEGFLLPNGLTVELFPERPPLKIYGYFASYQGGTLAALSALAALNAVNDTQGQFVDVSVQDAVLLVSAFAMQRLGDGSLEHRTKRNFRYGGVFQTKTGYVEVLTLEDRQWDALVELIGKPEWALDEELKDPLVRSARGAEINQHIRNWMIDQKALDVVARAQQLGVPVAKYRTPMEVIDGNHEKARHLFKKIKLRNGFEAKTIASPFVMKGQQEDEVFQVPKLNSVEGSII